MSLLQDVECAIAIFNIASAEIDAGVDGDAAVASAQRNSSFICTGLPQFSLATLIAYLRSNHVACTTYHSAKTQGPGTCCLAVQSGALTPPPAGTILPVYTPGSAASLPIGRIAQVTDSAGHCASCMIVGSSSRKHPGRPVLKYIRGGPSCPTSSQGCCTLSGASI